MNKKLKSALAAVFCLAVTACTTTTTSQNESSAAQQKTAPVRLNQMSENISLNLAGSNLSGEKTFDEILETTNVMNANNVLKNALEHALEDGPLDGSIAFSSSLNTEGDTSKQKIILTPSIVMSSNFALVDVFLTVVSGAENENKEIYFSQQVIENDNSIDNKEANKQYWLDNPIELRQKILDGLYDVATQFAIDFK